MTGTSLELPIRLQALAGAPDSVCPGYLPACLSVCVCQRQAFGVFCQRLQRDWDGLTQLHIFHARFVSSKCEQP